MPTTPSKATRDKILGIWLYVVQNDRYFDSAYQNCFQEYHPDWCGVFVHHVVKTKFIDTFINIRQILYHLLAN